MIETSKRNVPDLEFLFDSCFEALSRIKGKDSYFELPTLQDAPGLSAVFFLAITQKGFLLDEMVRTVSRDFNFSRDLASSRFRFWDHGTRPSVSAFYSAGSP